MASDRQVHEPGTRILDGKPWGDIEDSVVADVADWWARVAEADFGAAMPKADEYGGSTDGSADLKIIGYALSQLRMPEGVSESVQQQAACWFYELGKVARAITNLNKGEDIKPDTAHDGRVYWMMIERLRETGRWP